MVEELDDARLTDEVSLAVAVSFGFASRTLVEIVSETPVGVIIGRLVHLHHVQ